MSNTAPPRRPSRALRRTAYTTAALALLAGAGWLGLPPLLKHVAEDQIEAQSGRKASIGALSFNPFTLVLTVADLTVYEADRSSAALSAKALTVRAAPAALWRLAPLIQEVKLIEPRVRIVRSGPNTYNFSDVLERILAMPKSEKPTLFSVANIALENGAIYFDDRVTHKRVKIEALNIGLPFVSNFPEQVETFVLPSLSARVNGTPFALKGRSKPFAGSLDTALALDIDGLDLANYMAFAPLTLPVTLQAATLSTKLDLRFERKQGKPQVLLSGSVKLADVALQDKAAAPLLKADGIALTLAKLDLLAGAVALDRVDIVRPQVWLSNAAGDLVSAASIGVENLQIDSAARSVGMDALRLAGLDGEVRRSAAGKFNVQQLAARFAGPAAPAAPLTASATAPVKPAPPWKLTLKQFAVSDSALAYTDNAVKPAVKLRADALNLTLDDVSSQLDAPLTLALKTQLNKSGSLALDGRIAPHLASYELAVDAQNLPLAAVQPYFADALNVTLAAGQASSKGKLTLTPGEGGAATRSTYRGALRLANFRVLDKENAADFLKWRALDISGIDLKLGGPRQEIGMDKIALNDFYARVILSESAKLNLQDIVAAKDAPAGAPAPSLTSAAPAPSAPKAAAAKAPAKADAPLIRIGQVLIKGGNINYTDNFVKPNYTANLTGMNGSVGAISSDKARPAPIDLGGKIDNDAVVAISGSLNPLFAPMFLDIKASAKGVELPRLTPYAAKYAGYAIEKGKLSMSVNYRIENDQLVAQNDVRIDQLTFGEKIDSPTATKLPVLLAVALLKDRHGEININLPIAGTLSDPQFSVGGIIVRIFMNLIVKAVTSPFALLGSAFGGGDELGYAEFSPGSATLTAATRGKLDTLGKALAERPGLKLDLTGRVDPRSDADGVRQQILNLKLNALQRKESLDKGGDSAAEDVPPSAADREKYMGKVYAAQKFDKPRNALGFAKSLPVAEMEKLILANTVVTQDALRALANRRAEAVRAYFESHGAVEPARIFLIAPKLSVDGIDDKGQPNRVDFALK
ncbi:DUF748 domain-containing protein [Janthinobacterium sp.]|uniref:DUF748 domain-containing protein n=1 Tax=Janthinobacterium sp. TaxID=1871054 RepID=UPI00293D3F3D|nr:DUF748 domain-containing protein [Janthinobacterium sp.]